MRNWRELDYREIPWGAKPLSTGGQEHTHTHHVGIVRACIIHERLGSYNFLVHLPTPFERSKLGLEVVRKQLILDLNKYITDKCFVRVCIRILAVDLKFDTLDGIAEEINVYGQCGRVVRPTLKVAEVGGSCPCETQLLE